MKCGPGQLYAASVVLRVTTRELYPVYRLLLLLQLLLLLLFGLLLLLLLGGELDHVVDAQHGDGRLGGELDHLHLGE